MFATLVATLVRAAVCTLKTWESGYDALTLNLRNNDDINLSMYHEGNLSPDFWDAPPIAATLREAAQGFPEHPL
jgi:hypothetical protein